MPSRETDLGKKKTGHCDRRDIDERMFAEHALIDDPSTARTQADLGAWAKGRKTNSTRFKSKQVVIGSNWLQSNMLETSLSQTLGQY
jgi:hypothetical protein